MREVPTEQRTAKMKGEEWLGGVDGGGGTYLTNSSLAGRRICGSSTRQVSINSLSCFGRSSVVFSTLFFKKKKMSYRQPGV